MFSVMCLEKYESTTICEVQVIFRLSFLISSPFYKI